MSTGSQFWGAGRCTAVHRLACFVSCRKNEQRAGPAEMPRGWVCSGGKSWSSLCQALPAFFPHATEQGLHRSCKTSDSRCRKGVVFFFSLEVLAPVLNRRLNIWSCFVKNLVHSEKTGRVGAGKVVIMRLGANTWHHILGLQLPSWWSWGKLNSRCVDDSNWGSIYDGGGEQKKSLDLSVCTHLMLRHRLQKLLRLARSAVTLSGFAQSAVFRLFHFKEI